MNKIVVGKPRVSMHHQRVSNLMGTLTLLLGAQKAQEHF